MPNPGQHKTTLAQWRLLVRLMLSTVIQLDCGGLSIAGPLVQDELGLNPTQLGILFFSFFCAYAACMIGAGWLADLGAAGFFLWCAINRCDRVCVRLRDAICGAAGAGNARISLAGVYLWLCTAYCHRHDLPQQAPEGLCQSHRRGRLGGIGSVIS